VDVAERDFSCGQNVDALKSSQTGAYAEILISIHSFSLSDKSQESSS
jgi:hypothetical protein